MFSSNSLREFLVKFILLPLFVMFLIKSAFAPLKTRRGLAANVTQWFLGSLLVTCRSAIGQFFPVPCNSPRSLCECKLVPVSFSFLKLRIAQLMWRVVSFSFRLRAYGTLNVRSLLDVREQYLNEFSFPDPYAEVMAQADSSIMNFHLRLS